MPVPRDAGVDSVDRIDVDERDGIVQRLHMPQTQTAWNVIYTALKRALPAGVVHAGESFERLGQADPLVGADGGRSSARSSFGMRGRRMRAMSRGAGSSTNASFPSRYYACCANVSRFSKATRIFS
ncbi:hypothetical protein BGV67_02010 [Burkholderia ubonensis]|nr:hypothetical protein WL41_10050 [Burkholderia ubonensis]OJA76769.1 hypothetical protein BGV67_02010 [Burkholderia ubonensis]